MVWTVVHDHNDYSDSEEHFVGVFETREDAVLGVLECIDSWDEHMRSRCSCSGRSEFRMFESAIGEVQCREFSFDNDSDEWLGLALQIARGLGRVPTEAEVEDRRAAMRRAIDDRLAARDEDLARALAAREAARRAEEAQAAERELARLETIATAAESAFGIAVPVDPLAADPLVSSFVEDAIECRRALSDPAKRTNFDLKKRAMRRRVWGAWSRAEEALPRDFFAAAAEAVEAMLGPMAEC